MGDTPTRFCAKSTGPNRSGMLQIGRNFPPQQSYSGASTITKLRRHSPGAT